jgi:nucleoside-diphosphate-sugar epimerase
VVQRVLVIGGTGFLGPDVTRLLEERGADVTVFHSGQHETPDAPSTTRHIHGTRDELGRALTASGGEPEVVIDMAPMTAAQIEQTMRALDARNVRLVVISSSDVYRTYGLLRMLESGPPEPVPLREDAPLRTVLYPDRTSTPHDQREGLDPNEYDKILVERVARSMAALHAQPSCGWASFLGRAHIATTARSDACWTADRRSCYPSVGRLGAARPRTARTSQPRSSSRH